MGQVFRESLYLSLYVTKSVLGRLCSWPFIKKVCFYSTILPFNVLIGNKSQANWSRVDDRMNILLRSSHVTQVVCLSILWLDEKVIASFLAVFFAVQLNLIDVNLDESSCSVWFDAEWTDLVLRIISRIVCSLKHSAIGVEAAIAIRRVTVESVNNISGVWRRLLDDCSHAFVRVAFLHRISRIQASLFAHPVDELRNIRVYARWSFSCTAVSPWNYSIQNPWSSNWTRSTNQRSARIARTRVSSAIFVSSTDHVLIDSVVSVVFLAPFSADDLKYLLAWGCFADTYFDSDFLEHVREGVDLWVNPAPSCRHARSSFLKTNRFCRRVKSGSINSLFWI